MAGRTGGCRCCPQLRLLACLSMLTISRAIASLYQGDSIRDGQTLVSAGGVFELGFFSPGVSSNRYVGVWYKRITGPTTVVWVANRERPLTSRSGVLTVNSRGSLTILDGSTGRSVQVLAPGFGANSSAMATLLDSGNLVLQSVLWGALLPNSTEEPSRRVLWQSFDYPTDTWLPGMRLGKTRTGGLNRQLTSWRSPSDPSPGGFVFGADAEGPRMFISGRGTVSWSSGVWSGQFFSNDVSDLPYFFASIGNLSYHSNASKADDAYFEYSSTTDLTRFVMETGGQVRLSAWDSQNGEWVVLWAAPVRQQCEIPGYCGDDGLCNSAATPTCTCLHGFEPHTPARWASGDWSGGCLRLTPLSCGDGDGFLRLRGVKLPPALSSNYAGDVLNPQEGSCRLRCLAKCHCTAYALAYKNRPGCFMWVDQLLGLQSSSEDGSGSEIYVRLAESDGRRKRLLVVALPVVYIIVLCGPSLCCFLLIIRKGRKGVTGEELLLRDIGMDGAVAYKFVNVGEGGGERPPDIYLYSLSNILTATNNFSDANKLGEGGFGPVYKGKLPDGQEIAIKRLSTRSGQGLREFKTEILLIARLQHKNLVRLLGCCIQGEERLLVYEYMPNKSLDFFLFDPNRASQLDWSRRVEIIEGISQGLLYLHKYSRLTIIHRDLKASNILLDDKMNPKISDFGMARICSSNESQTNTSRIVGTFGYMSPEYAMEGLFSVKSDVFSFGVLLLEIVSGKKNVGSHQHLPVPRSLIGYAWELWKAGRELELMDPALGGSFPGREVSRCIYAGLMCVQERAVDRPTMAEVVAMLASESSAHEAPKPPAFFTENHTTRKGFSAEFAAASSPNDVTISVIEGR